MNALEAGGTEIVEPEVKNLALFSYDVLHLHFPTHHITEYGFLRAAVLSCVMALYLVAARALRKTIVYTVHDVVPFKIRHDIVLWSFLGLVHAVANAFVFLNRSSRKSFIALYPRHRDKPWALVPHGPYAAASQSPEQRCRFRHELVGTEPAFLIGFLGAIKPYKNIRALRHIPARLLDGRGIHLVIAGRVEPGHEAVVSEVAESFPPGQLRRIDRRLDDDELSRLTQVVDLLMLPYSKGYNSGAATLALSNFTRMIVSDLPGFRELYEMVGEPWIYVSSAADSYKGYADLIERAAGQPVTDEDRSRLRDYLNSTEWPSAAKVVQRLYDLTHARSELSAPLYDGTVARPAAMEEPLN